MPAFSAAMCNLHITATIAYYTSNRTAGNARLCRVPICPACNGSCLHVQTFALERAGLWRKVCKKRS